MINAFKPNEPAMPIRLAAVDGPTLDLLLRPAGAVIISTNFEKTIAFAVKIDESHLAVMVSEHGDEDGKTAIKDAILRDLDDRLVKILGL